MTLFVLAPPNGILVVSFELCKAAIENHNNN